jgi:hypothetical protein
MFQAIYKERYKERYSALIGREKKSGNVHII